MTIRRHTVPTQVRALAEDQVEVTISTSALVRQDGLVLVPQGCRLDDYRRNPIILFNHDPEAPIGRAIAISADVNKISARVQFAPSGISAKADEIRGLVKAGVISAASIVFDYDPADAEWIDPRDTGAGKRVNKWTLHECSFVAVPADPGALVTARALAAAPALTLAHYAAASREKLYQADQSLAQQYWRVRRPA